MADTAVRTASARQRSPLPRPGTGTLVRAAVVAALLLLALFALPQLMSLYYIDSMTQVAVWTMAALGLGVLVGRVGLVSLGQVAVLAIGAWVAAGCCSPPLSPTRWCCWRPAWPRCCSAR